VSRTQGSRWRRGPLAERDFRLLFGATTITTFGDRLGALALVFAVLDLPGGNATKLGIVLAARLVVEALVVVAGGVLADRLPRSVVLVGASLLQGTAQAATAWYILSGGTSIWPIVALQAGYGVGGGLVTPAEIGLIPQTVSPERLQQANALQGLARNALNVIGPSVAGVIIVAGTPGIALAVDAATFFVCAGLLALIRVAQATREATTTFVDDLREGWGEFWARTWLWASVILIGLANAVFAGTWFVLGPAIAKDDLGGAGAWATIAAVGGIGAIIGGLIAFRYRPRRPLFASSLVAIPQVAQLILLAFHAPVWLLAATTFVGQIGLAIGVTLWFTVFQQNIPGNVQSRVSSYDTFGSFVMIPLAMAVAGPIAAGIGEEETLLIAAASYIVFMGVTAALPSVRAIRQQPVAGEVVEPGTA
jgi:MFS family permease